MTSKSLNRRHLLKAVAATSCLPVCGGFLHAIGAEVQLQVHQLNPRMSLISGAGGNVVLFMGDTTATLIDTGAAQHTAALLRTVDTLTGSKAIGTVFNTHWYEDHTGGNEALHTRGAQIIAHENTRLWLGADFEVVWRQWQHTPRPAAALPDITFYSDGHQDLDGEIVQYRHTAQSCTDGDIFLYFPVSNVLVTGGLMSDRRYPVTDIATGGWIGGLIQANAAMLAMIDEKTVIVPERGPVATKADLQEQYDMLTAVYEKMKDLAQQGYSGHDMLKEKITADFDARWGDPEEFILETYRGMWAHTSDLGGFI